jgi:hypothetical protein
MEKENEGAGLEPGVLRELAQRGLTIDFDVYSPPAERSSDCLRS